MKSIPLHIDIEFTYRTLSKLINPCSPTWKTFYHTSCLTQNTLSMTSRYVKQYSSHEVYLLIILAHHLSYYLNIPHWYQLYYPILIDFFIQSAPPPPPLLVLGMREREGFNGSSMMKIIMANSWLLRNRYLALFIVFVIVSLSINGDNGLGRELIGRDRYMAMSELFLSSS